ncbi:MAG: aminoacetone oxidase family FAD-binding enzyme [Candidatus Omnitrophica bacterium]|nr:aminoacetone oxidase family FAD-binding enzyme [Candidatus Omnitrophota bacterium]
MKRFCVAIIGGGAAGITAAISASRKGDAVVICERMPQLGKKILISGNGRCNLLNEEISPAHYNAPARALLKSTFSRFGKNDILDFFARLGLQMHSKDGRVFPITNQSSSVLRVLDMELARLGVSVEFGYEAASILASKSGFAIESKKGAVIECDRLILAGGGKTYPALGSDGNTYDLAKCLGHNIIAPVPSAVPLTARDPLCQALQGQKIFAGARGMINGKIVNEAQGELLFTRYGLSGTSILDISEEISIAIHRRRVKDVVVSADMVPFMSGADLLNELSRRVKAGFDKENLLAGILPNKFSPALQGIFEERDIRKAVNGLKDRRFNITGTRGWNEAEFTSGGVDAGEIREGTLESRLRKGIYFAGEMIDVGGKRGGYHLAWAWASGFVAGLTGGDFTHA